VNDTTTTHDYDELLLEAYNGELFGNAIFSEMAGRDEWHDHREALQLLATIEERTAAGLRPLVDAAGIDAGDGEEARRSGRDLGALGGSWDGFVKALFDALPPFLANFARLREVAPDPHHPAIAALVAHEQTISAFAQLEIAGFHDVSTALLTRYLETAR
jgi:hypothetical protein